jgi:hypothetical protein
MYKLQIFVITNICKPIFVNFRRIGTRSPMSLKDSTADRTPSSDILGGAAFLRGSDG